MKFNAFRPKIQARPVPFTFQLMIITLSLVISLSNPFNVWGAITIRAGGAFQLNPAPLNIDLEIGERYKFKATAFRNPHNFPTAPGIEIDPKFGWIEFSATGKAKKKWLQSLKNECGVLGLFCSSNNFSHSIDYKWKKRGDYSVTAKIFDEDGVEHDSVTWNVQVGNLHDELNVRRAPSTVGYPIQNMLLPNYPNPFNPETWIPYQLANDSNVQISIYNSQGVLVRVLPLGHQFAGYYMGRERAAYWDGKNMLGERVASGIYFYQLETDTLSSMRKMVILK